MNRRARDFVSLFNAFWYRDFPITADRIDISRRALWTTHIASTVKLAADHLGLYTCFETGGRTDAVIQCRRAFKTDQLCALNFDQGFYQPVMS